MSETKKDTSWIMLAKSGICPECNHAMPAITQEAIDEHISDTDEECPMSCEQCGIDIMINSSEWDVEAFDHYCPGSLDTEIKRKYVEIMSQCDSEKKHSQLNLWHKGKITYEQHKARCEELEKIYKDKFIAFAINEINP